MAHRRTLTVLLLAVLCGVLRVAQCEPVTLQLKWQHAFQFAGYYAAQEKGYYRDAGFEVSIQQASPGENAVDDVLAGKAQFGVGTSSLLLERHAGKPVVVLGVIFQHSPYILISGKDGRIQSVHDIVDRRIMLEPLSDEILAYLRREGVPLNRIRKQEHSFDIADLIKGRTDAIAAYSTNQPYYLRRAGFPFQVFSPRMGGIDFYGDNLFTSESYLKRFPERVRAFREASLRGWDYAMNHPEEMIELIVNRYATTLSRDYLGFEAEQMKELVQASLVPIGYMHPGRWKHIAETYAEIGMLPADVSLRGFLYEPDPVPDHDWLYRVLAVITGVLLLVGAVALQFFRMNRKLKASMCSLGTALDRLKVLSTAVEQSPSAILVTDSQTRIEYANPQLCAISGYALEEVMGQPASLFKSGETAPSTYQAMWESLSAGLPWHGELLNRTKSGAHYWEEVNIAPVKNDAGVIEHFVSIKQDVTRRKRAEEEARDLIGQLKVANQELQSLNASLELAVVQLHQSEKMAAIGQLAAGVAHEINTPLGFIKSNIGSFRRHVEGLLNLVDSYAEADALMASQPALKAKIEAAKRAADLHFLREDNRSLIDESFEGVERIASIVRNLKEFTAVDSSELSCLSLEESLDRTVALLGHELGSNIEIRREYGGVPPVECVAAQINQVFLSILGNAIEAMAGSGRIVMRTACDEASVWVEIEDNGKGIPAAIIHRVFDPFFTTKPVGSGTGLGLSLVYGIVQRHRGQISVTSRPAESTVFRIRLPRS